MGFGRYRALAFKDGALLLLLLMISAFCCWGRKTCCSQSDTSAACRFFSFGYFGHQHVLLSRCTASGVCNSCV